MIKHPRQHERTQDMPKWVWECVEDAWKWVCNKYGYDINDLHLPAFRWSYNARFDVFYDYHPRYFSGNTPHIRLAHRNNWVTYKRKTIGVWAYVKNVDKHILKTINCVHELTHYIQHIEGRDKSEVETTRNEIAFVKENYYHLYKQLTPIED